jgi:hypothetical protein
MSRDDVAAYFASLFHGKLSRSYSHGWDRLVVAVADLPAPELMDDVRQAYAEGLVDSFFARLEQIEKGNVRRRRKDVIITDAIAEMEWWACFHKPQKATAAPPEVSPKPVQHKKPWRNAPCPCGSGLKYKKCCGASKK